jgi:hypothetical protein
MKEKKKPYLTAPQAAEELGYKKANYLTSRCQLGKIPGAYKAGSIWLIPTTWVEKKKEDDAQYGIIRGTRRGRHVTTGAGLARKRPGYTGTGNPPGRPPASKTGEGPDGQETQESN